MFDIFVNTLTAWNQIGLLLMASVCLLIGGVICGYDLYWRIFAKRVRGRISGVRVTQEVRNKKSDYSESTDESSQEYLSEGLKDAAKSQPFASAFFLLLFCGIPLIFVGFGAYQAYEYVHLTNTGEYAQATVIDNDKSYDDEGGVSYKAVLRFNDASGRSWKVKDSISYGSSPSYKKGTVIGVYYDAEDPKNFVIHDFWHHMAIAIIFMVFGSAFILFIPFMVWLGKKSEGKPKSGRTKKRSKSFANEMYYAVFEYKAPNGNRLECVGDIGSGSIFGRIPGTPVTLYMFPDNPEKVRRPKLFIFMLGLVFLLPGLFIMNVALTQFETNGMTFVLIFAGLVFVAYKIFDKIRHIPFEDMKKGWSEMREQGVKVSSSSSGSKGRLLTEDEIKPRIKAHAKNALISGYVTLVLALGLAVGGYYAGISMIEFTQEGVVTTGKVVDMKRNRSSDSSDTYSAIVRFNDHQGQSYKFKDSVGSSHPSFKTGDEVSVMYLPEDPDHAMIDRGIWNWGLSAGLWAGTLLFLWSALHSFGLVRRYGGTKYRGRV